MVSGFNASTFQGKEIAGNIVVTNVRHSQRMNDRLVNIYIFAESVHGNYPVGKYSLNC